MILLKELQRGCGKAVVILCDVDMGIDKSLNF